MPPVARSIPSKPQIVLNALRCDQCLRVLVSISVHDFQACACGTFTDGGREYLRRGTKEGVTFTDLTLVFLPDRKIIMLAKDIS